MKAIALHNLGGFGNLLFRWAHAKAFCEKNGYDLHTEPWPGEEIFTLDGYQPVRPDGREEIILMEYRQAQKDLIYTREDCRRWFALKPEIERALTKYRNDTTPAAHFRRGDYAGAGYPLISRQSVEKAMEQYCIGGDALDISDDHPLKDPGFRINLSFVPDFYRLMRAPVLFRANSSFSWWAAVLSNGRVFSPVITGLAPSVEHDNVPYVEGNWPRLCELEFVTDLHLMEA